MSEYWKSTPKYWCKHCKTFVRDTKLEKTNHEATPKHQGNLKRFLRELHKGHEREEREKQRAKDEVDRLNGVVSGSGPKVGLPWERKPAIPAIMASRQATPADRQKQLAQLAGMGVAVPEDFRKEMAMAGDWQTTSQRLIYEDVKKEEENKDVKPQGLNIGVRKRKFEGQEEEEAAGETVIRKGWGSTLRTYPGASGDGEDDLDALFKTTRTIRKDADASNDPHISSSTAQAGEGPTPAPVEGDVKTKTPQIKREESSNDGQLSGISQNATKPSTIDASFKQEEDAGQPCVLFKKRKARPIRQN